MNSIWTTLIQNKYSITKKCGPERKKDVENNKETLRDFEKNWYILCTLLYNLSRCAIYEHHFFQFLREMVSQLCGSMKGRRVISSTQNKNKKVRFFVKLKKIYILWSELHRYFLQADSLLLNDLIIANTGTFVQEKKYSCQALNCCTIELNSRSNL